MPTTEVITTLDTTCPICGNPITLSVFEEIEYGEFGSILSRYLVVDSDSFTIDQHDYCVCDFSKPLSEVIAHYLNVENRLAELLDTIESKRKDEKGKEYK